MKIRKSRDGYNICISDKEYKELRAAFYKLTESYGQEMWMSGYTMGNSKIANKMLRAIILIGGPG